MGFSSGASSAKRKAAKAAAQQYLAEFRKLKPIDALPRLASNNKKTIREELDDNASFRVRNMAQKADRMARAINKDDDYKNKIDAYNDRYEILKRQMANQSTTRYGISGSPIETAKTSNGFGGFGTYQGGSLGGSQGGLLGGNGVLSILGNQQPANKPQSSFATQGKMYQTKEEAMADATKQMETYNSGLSKLIGTNKPQSQLYGSGFIAYANPYTGQYTKADVDAMRINDPSRFIQQENFDGFGVLYRDLSKAESALNDINALSNNITNSAGNKNIDAYAALASKLKPMIKKEAKNAEFATGNQSLVANELAQNSYTETM